MQFSRFLDEILRIPTRESLMRSTSKRPEGGTPRKTSKNTTTHQRQREMKTVVNSVKLLHSQFISVALLFQKLKTIATVVNFTFESFIELTPDLYLQLCLFIL